MHLRFLKVYLPYKQFHNRNQPILIAIGQGRTLSLSQKTATLTADGQ